MPRSNFDIVRYWKIRECIFDYIWNKCLETRGNTVTITFSECYEHCKKIEQSQNRFKYYWTIILKMLQDKEIHSNRHKGKHVLDISICDELFLIKYVSDLATKKLEIEKTYRKDEEILYWLKRLLDTVAQSNQSNNETGI